MFPHREALPHLFELLPVQQWRGENPRAGRSESVQSAMPRHSATHQTDKRRKKRWPPTNSVLASSSDAWSPWQLLVPSSKARSP